MHVIRRTLVSLLVGAALVAAPPAKAGFLQDLARVACDYGLAVNTVEVHVHSPELRIAIASRDLRTFRRLWRSVEPNPNRGA